jgi:hypothetical protein
MHIQWLFGGKEKAKFNLIYDFFDRSSCKIKLLLFFLLLIVSRRASREILLFSKRFMLITWDLVLNNLTECVLPLVENIKRRRIRNEGEYFLGYVHKNVQFLIGLFSVSCFLLLGISTTNGEE